MSDPEVIPARHGKATRLKQGRTVTVINTSGTQVVDTWAFCAEDMGHFMSMEHSRVWNGRLCAPVGGQYVTNRREPILRVIADDSPGIHDTLMAACDLRRYELMGCEGYHRNCHDNMTEALAELGLAAPVPPAPLNLFMNIPVHADQTLEQGAPSGKPGNSIALRAERDCIVVFSACPQDRTPINGNMPTDAHFRID